MSTAFRLLTFLRKTAKMSKTFKEMAQEVERKSNQKIEEQEKWVAELTEWDLEDREFSIPIVRTTPLTLEKEMRALAETKEAASMVGLPILEQTALTALSLANALFKKSTGDYFKLPGVKPQDYLVSTKDLCRQVTETKVKLEDLKIKDGRAAGVSVEGGGVDGSAVGGRGGDESDESDVESVDVDDRAGARVEASGGDDGAVVAGEVGGGKSGNGGVEVTVVVEESGGVRVKVGAEGGSVEGGGVEESAVGGRGGDESDESDVESVEFVGVNFDDRAGARVEASGGDDGAVVAGEVGDGKSGNGGVEVDDEVGFVVKKARGGDGKSGGLEGGVEGDGVKVDPNNPMRQCHFCDYCG